ncbi:hypothetical protein TNCV_1194911 [Trichonephila clavipes]|nr:hypothetical protein TNCV_1194911 [Trichonephila clavipes]
MAIAIRTAICFLKLHHENDKGTFNSLPADLVAQNIQGRFRKHLVIHYVIFLECVRCLHHFSASFINCGSSNNFSNGHNAMLGIILEPLLNDFFIDFRHPGAHFRRSNKFSFSYYHVQKTHFTPDQAKGTH